MKKTILAAYIWAPVEGSGALLFPIHPYAPYQQAPPSAVALKGPEQMTVQGGSRTQGSRGQHATLPPPPQNWSRVPGVSIPPPSMGFHQWSTTNVGYLTVVAVASCMVGYSGTVYLNTPVSTTLQAVQGL